jgi:bifunctional non-homologous end joining protein LigD
MNIAGVSLSNPDRVLYQDTGVTKRALAAYYEAIAPVMLPHTAGRPLSLVRCPEGQHKGCFYQKHWTTTLPPQVKRVDLRESGGEVEPYTMIRGAGGLVALVQLGVLEIHVWGARADDVEAPDRLVFDLDPAPDVPWRRVVEAARELKERLDGLGLESWLKTSGGKGLHLVVPFIRRYSWDQVAGFTRAVAYGMAADSPDRYLAKASKVARQGRIFVDWVRNTRGATAIAPWSTRARPDAPISLPLGWDALDRLKSGDQFTIDGVERLIRRQWQDPWADLRKSRQRLNLSVIKQASR